MATIMRARVVMQQTGYSHANLLQTFWRPGTSGGSNADALDVLTRVRTMLNACVALFQTSVIWTPTLEVDALEDSTGAITGAYTATALGPVTGTNANDLLPVQTALIVRSTTNLIVGGRILKGRTFMPGFTEAFSLTLGTPSSTNATTVQNAFTALLTGGTTASFPVVWHRPSAAGAGTSGPVVSYQAITQYWGTQRRRRF